MTKRNPDGTGLTRREAIRKGAGVLLGATAMLTGTGELASLAAQGPGNNVQATPLPATDPRFPMPPTWNRELRQLAPNVYAYTQGGGPAMAAGVSNLGMIAGPALAGVLVAVAGLPITYMVDVATFVVGLVCLALMRAVPPPVDAARPSIGRVLEGIRYAKGRPELIGQL